MLAERKKTDGNLNHSKRGKVSVGGCMYEYVMGVLQVWRMACNKNIVKIYFQEVYTNYISFKVKANELFKRFDVYNLLKSSFVSTIFPSKYFEEKN